MQKSMVVVLFFVLFSGLAMIESSAEITDTHKNALADLYYGTSGDEWTENYGWLSGSPCSWYGVDCDQNAEKIVGLWLSENNLAGELPESIGDLSDLQYLGLWSNKLSGTIPDEIGDLAALKGLYLNDNRFSGGIPESIGDLSRLEKLYLWGNQLSGPIPEALWRLRNLSVLEMADNDLSGGISKSVGQLTGLEYFGLTRNRITGSIPEELGNLSRLETLALGGNDLTGEIPASIWKVVALREIYLWGNRLSGAIPVEIGNLGNLSYLWMSDNGFTGGIPEALGTLSNLEYLFLGNNMLTGEIPDAFANLKNLVTLSLEENGLEGEIPAGLGFLSKLEELNLENNMLSGSIPSTLGKLLALKELDLSGNRLTGTIPEEIGNLVNLEVLLLDGNRLSGSIPRELAKLVNLEDGNSDFRHNGLFAADPVLREFLFDKQDGRDWETSQNNPNKLYYPHIAAKYGWNTEIGAINSGDVDINGVFKAYNADGECLPEDITVFLPPNSRKELNIGDDFDKPGKISYIAFLPDGPNMSGYTKFYISGKYRAALPAVAKVNSGPIYIPHIASNDIWTTGIGLINTTPSVKELGIEFNTGETVAIEMEAGEHRAFTVRSLFDGKARPDMESAVILDGSGVVGLELFGGAPNAGNNYFSGILLNGETEKTIYYPHIANDQTWWTGVVTYNPSAQECLLAITPYDRLGNPRASLNVVVPARGKYVGLIENLDLPSGTAWFKAEASAEIVGFELFGDRDGSKLAGFSGIGVKSRQGNFSKIEKDGWTGVAFVNTENRAVTVQLIALDDSGESIAVEIFELAANAKVVAQPRNLFDEDIGCATFIKYSADGDIFGFQLNNSSDDMMLDALPGYKSVDPANVAPVADAGIDRRVSTGSYVVLDGSGSYDADGDFISHYWEMVSTPPGSNASLFAERFPDPDFMPDKAGTYQFRLVVDDGMASSSPDIVFVTATTVFPTENDSHYADVLLECIDENGVENSCSMTKLPLIGQDFENPTVEDVMDRVVVSHKWMATRFREVLGVLPDDILCLLKATRGIYIASDVRPSYYWSYTGAIYLDPLYLWRTAGEKATVDMKPDYRSAFGRELNYYFLNRYLKDNEYTYVSNWSESENRSLDEIKYNVARLLYHELAHANDFMQPSKLATISRDQRFYDAVKAVQESRISELVAERYLLNSKMLRALGQVNFHGENPTPEQIALTPETVAGEFENDTATDDYNYSTIMEDVAMFFEETMMHRNFGIDRDIAITNVPEVPDATSSDYIVAWGQRNRFADPALREKAEFIAEGIMPDSDWPSYFDSLSPPTLMVAGESWRYNQYMDSSSGVRSRLKDEVPLNGIGTDREEIEILVPYE